MTRRAAILASAIGAFAQENGRREQKNKLPSQGFEIGPVDETIALELDIDNTTKAKVTAILVRADGREARISPKELMDALEGKPHA